MLHCVTRALEIISEATRRLPNEMKDLHPAIDWPAMGVFKYARLKLYISELINASDVVNRGTLKPLLRENILRDAGDTLVSWWARKV